MNLSYDDHMRLAGFIKKRYGLNLENKKSLVESRLANYAQNMGFDDFKNYIDYVFADKSGYEIANLISFLTTNHTYFMREAEHFAHLSESFLPEAEKRVKDHDLRIWSAGCSFGNEPYTVAMCLNEYFGSKKLGWDCRILATDISITALMTAKDAIYKEDALTGLPDSWIDKYFVKLTRDSYQVCDRIRNEVVFRYHNLMDPITFKKKFDLIICRNVMIYFDNNTKDKLCKRFYNATEEGGYLYIGHTETIDENSGYKRVQPAVFRKEGAV